MKKTLVYHSIEDRVKEAGAGLYCVSEAKFRAQMEHVRKMGTVPFGDSPHVTFDDGDMTNYTKAYPILKELGMKAYFFIIGEWVGAPGYMDWQEIKELQAGGMTIGSHGMTHRIVTTMDDKELDYEFGSSKILLEKNLGVTVDTVSIPRGIYNKKVIDKIKACGYSKVFTSDPKDRGDFLSGRIPVRADWDMAHFIRAVTNGPSFTDNLMAAVKKTSRTILGDKNYDLLRTKVLK